MTEENRVAELVKIWQVLLLRNRLSSRTFDRAVWAAFLEVEAFYNQDQQRVVFERTYLSDSSPLGIIDSFFGSWKGLDWRQVTDDFWERARGRFSRTFDQQKLAALASEFAGGQSRGIQLIVTDQEITPPKEWRYIIWDGTSKGVVVAIPPTDPEYWRETNDDRITTIKHRIRSVCLMFTGRFLGLERCGNPRCFMFDDVDSVLRLDEMVCLGGEHEAALPKLINKGFEVRSSDPNKVQSIVDVPRVEGSAA